MGQLDFLPEKAKKYLREQLGPKKRETNISEKAKQKKELDFFCQLLDIKYEKTRKLNYDFNEETNFEERRDFILRDEEVHEYIKKEETKKETKTEPEPIETQDNISIEDIVKYFKQRGVVGEEDLAIKIFLAASNNMSFGVEGYSGSGKTFVVDKLIDLFEETELYRLDLSSKMAVFYDSKNINKYKTIYIPELQKALQETKSPIVEVVKNLTEGKDVKRIVTNQNKKGNNTFRISKGKSIIYTLASENYYKNDEELNRRFLRFKTNSTKEHLEDILRNKSNKRQELNYEEDEEETKEKLKKHLSYVRKIDTKVFDPYSEYISQFLPRTQKSVGYVDHYFSLVDASARFNYKNRLILEHNNKKIIVADIEDHVLIHKVYHTEFLETLKEFSKRNKFHEEITEIEELQEKEIKWEEALKQGLSISKQKLGRHHEYYEEIEKNQQQYLNSILRKYERKDFTF